VSEFTELCQCANETVSLRGSSSGFPKQARPGVNPYFETVWWAVVVERLPREQMIETVIAGIDGPTSSPHGSPAKFLVTSNVR